MLGLIPTLLVPNAPKWALPNWYDYQQQRGTPALGFPPGVDTHGQTIYAPSSSGMYQSFAANVPVLTNAGLQTVPTRINNCPNPQIAGVVAGTPGTAPTSWGITGTSNGITRTIVGSGTDPITGLPYFDVEYSGTTVGVMDFILDPMATTAGAAAASGQAWTASVWLSLLSGTLPGTAIVYAQGRDAGNAVTEATTATSFAGAGATPTRYVSSGTFANVNTAKVTQSIRIQGIGAGVVVAPFRLRISLPQLEQGAFASSPIVANQTTNGNQQVISGLGTQLVTGVAGLIQANMLGSVVGSSRILSFGDLTTNNELRIYNSGGNWQARIEAAGVNQGLVSLGPAAVGITTIAFIFTNNYFTGRIVGQSAPTPDTSATYPGAALTGMQIGGQYGGDTNNNYQHTKKLGLRYLTPSDDPATVFAEVFAKAQLAAAA